MSESPKSHGIKPESWCFMQPKETPKKPQEELFRSRLDQILDPNHALFRLANQIEWSVFEQELGALYTDLNRPGFTGDSIS